MIVALPGLFSYLFCSPISEYRIQKYFSPIQGWSDVVDLVTDRHVKLQFLERLQISG